MTMFWKNKKRGLKMSEKNNEELKNETVDETVEVSAENEEKTEEQKLREELAANKDMLLRTAAEYDNYRKRTQKELAERYEDAKIFVIGKILPAFDNFDRALNSVEGDSDDFKKGMDMIYRQMNDILKDLGVTEFGEIGDEFDANLHNAVMHIDDESLGENVISDVFQKGYKLEDKIIRHAMVKVAN